MIRDVSKEELIARGGISKQKLLPLVKEIREILDDFDEVNRLLEENWILIGVLSNSVHVKHIMGRIDLNQLNLK